MKTLTLKFNAWLLRNKCGCMSAVIVEDAMLPADRRTFQRRAKTEPHLILERPRTGETVTINCDDEACIGRAFQKVNEAKRFAKQGTA